MRRTRLPQTRFELGTRHHSVPQVCPTGSVSTSRCLLAVCLFLAQVAATGCAYDPSVVPSRYQGELDGLERIRPTPWDERHRRPGLQLSRYRGVHLLPVVLSETLDTQGEHYRDHDLERVRARFDAALEKEFADTGLLATRGGPGVIDVRTVLTGVRANRPPFDMTEDGIARTTRGVGGATVQIDLVDAQTGDPLEAFVDRKWGAEFSSNYNRNQTWGDADEAFRWWAHRLRSSLANGGLEGGG